MAPSPTILTRGYVRFVARPALPARPRTARPRAIAAAAVTILGALAVIAGALVLGGWPVALILTGAALVAVGLGYIDVDGT